jgi:hypothetical protein
MPQINPVFLSTIRNRAKMKAIPVHPGEASAFLALTQVEVRS